MSPNEAEIHQIVLRLLRAPHQQRLLNRCFGGLFVGAALLLATVRRAAPGA